MYHQGAHQVGPSLWYNPANPFSSTACPLVLGSPHITEFYMIFISKLLHPTPLMNSPASSSSTCMFTSATGYIFSFGLSRRRHEPPFKPGGSVGALVGRPGFRAGFARIRARGRGRGSVGAACSSRKKPLDLQSSYHLIYSLARPLPVRPPRVPLPTVCPNDTSRPRPREGV